MATTCETPTCAEGCEGQLPEVEFNICAPKTNPGQIIKVYQGNKGYPLTDENDLAEWQTRVNLPANDPARILEISVIADKPLPTDNEVAISRGRTASGNKDHVVNLRIDETNAVNYEYMRKTECGMTGPFWYETSGGRLYGGTTGVLATIKLGEVIPESTADLIVFQGTLKWKAKFSPCFTESPMAGIDLLEESGS